MGLVIFGLFALYLIISIVVVTAATRIAKKKGRSARRWGIGAALVMYLLVFWDHIPTMLVHKYYCATEGGYTLNKTLEEWKKENSGVAEALNSDPEISQQKYFLKSERNKRYYLLPDGSELISHYSNKGVHQFTDMRRSDGTRFSWINQRFVWERYASKLFLGIQKTDNRIVDIKTGKVLAQYVDFSTGQNISNPEEFRDVKFWISQKSCEQDGKKNNRYSFNKFENKLELLGRR